MGIIHKDHKIVHECGLVPNDRQPNKVEALSIENNICPYCKSPFELNLTFKEYYESHPKFGILSVK